jgi:hypothetical protein
MILGSMGKDEQSKPVRALSPEEVKHLMERVQAGNATSAEESRLMEWVRAYAFDVAVQMKAKEPEDVANEVSLQIWNDILAGRLRWLEGSENAEP